MSHMRTIRFHLTAMAVAGALLGMTAWGAEFSAANSPGHGNNSGSASRLSPVEYFRGLLGMTPSERDRILARKPAADRALILAKIHEYEALPRQVREARLCQTELHWELTTLMKLSPAERSNRLDEISVLYRPLVGGLLQQWDKVPGATQKALLEKESFIGTYLRLQGSSAAVRQEILDKLPPERRSHWAGEMDRWQALPTEERAELCAQFQRFFSLSDEAQKETISTLPAADRKETEEALHAFDALPGGEREDCIRSFRKFATMDPQDRAQFLNNAARWESMTTHERQVWRDLVKRLPPDPPGLTSNIPPMPPGFAEAQWPMPPMPPSVISPVIIARSTNVPR